MGCDRDARTGREPRPRRHVALSHRRAARHGTRSRSLPLPHGALVAVSSGHAAKDGGVYRFDGAAHHAGVEGLPDDLGGAVGPRQFAASGERAVVALPNGDVYVSDDSGRRHGPGVGRGLRSVGRSRLLTEPRSRHGFGRGVRVCVAWRTLRRASTVAKPAILTVDDDPAVLQSITRDLRNRFGDDYQIVRASSGADALKTARRVRHAQSAGGADRVRPADAGDERRRVPAAVAKELAPDAKLVLLTAYADTDVAIKAINDIGLDYYLLKPWDPPEGAALPGARGPARTRGTTTTRRAATDIRVVGHRWSDRSHEIKTFLAAQPHPYDGSTSSATRTCCNGSGWTADSHRRSADRPVPRS